MRGVSLPIISAHARRFSLFRCESFGPNVVARAGAVALGAGPGKKRSAEAMPPETRVLMSTGGELTQLS